MFTVLCLPVVLTRDSSDEVNVVQVEGESRSGGCHLLHVAHIRLCEQ